MRKTAQPGEREGESLVGGGRCSSICGVYALRAGPKRKGKQKQQKKERCIDQGRRAFFCRLVGCWWFVSREAVVDFRFLVCLLIVCLSVFRVVSLFVYYTSRVGLCPILLVAAFACLFSLQWI